jgi:biopolymer transport protein ExbD
MAEMIIAGNGNNKNGSNRSKKLSTRVDLTPMVDLGFLLITFFMVTTSMTKPKAMSLNMPADNKLANPPQLCESCALTLLLGKNGQVYYYEGKGDDPAKPPQVSVAPLAGANGIRSIIADKKMRVAANAAIANDFMVLIKSSQEARYKNYLALLDEMAINEVKKFAAVELSEAEKKWIME